MEEINNLPANSHCRGISQPMAIPLMVFCLLLGGDHAAIADSEISGLTGELEQLNKAIQNDAKLAEAYQQRGCVHFKLGQFTESVRDFDTYIQLRPDRKASHWQRGISCYYAGRFDEGRKQFEVYQKYDGNDVENAVWRFLCMAKVVGIPEAQKDMLKIGADRRLPMRQVYDMFSGRLKAADVLSVAQAGTPDQETLKRQLFYAHLYVGIYQDLAGEPRQALNHLEKAANEYCIDHYMGDVARVHRDLLKKRVEKK